jgi:hypothetical protein
MSNVVHLCENCHRAKATGTMSVGSCVYHLCHNCIVLYKKGFYGLVDKNKQAKEKEEVVFEPDFDLDPDVA